MGYFQGGGPGTPIIVYDDNDATGGHAVGQPHTPAELNTFDPLVWAILQTAAGATFSPSRRQYLLTALTTFGSTTPGNINVTTIELKNCDVFAPNNRFQFTTANSALYQRLFMGTKVGTNPKIAGHSGATLHLAAIMNFRCTLGIYGSFVSDFSAASISLLNNGAEYQEVGGSVFQSSTGSYALGNADFGPLSLYYCTFASNTTSDVVINSFIDDSEACQISATAPRSFVSAPTPKTVTKVNFVGTPGGSQSAGDVRQAFTTGSWKLNEIGWSNSPTTPRIRMISEVPLGSSNKEYLSIDTKICTILGDSLQAIPVWVETDIEGLVADTQTGFDGNIVFTNPNTPMDNAILVRDHYSGPLSSATVADNLYRDRVITITVNGIGGLFPANPNYETRIMVFEWPGRDRFGNTYVTDGGSFIKIMMPITLRPGHPTARSIWDECSVDGL